MLGNQKSASLEKYMLTGILVVHTVLIGYLS